MSEETKNINKETDVLPEEPGGMKPIWFFVGLILFFIGLVLILAGIYNYYHPAQSGTVMEYMHPDIWWGGIMFITGAGFVFFTRNSTVE
ncbi:MAG TPA: hypothetical protein VKA34_00405 [Balneolales bacterium]|nr:hypothetical protein [Balneolales bacterium]